MKQLLMIKLDFCLRQENLISLSKKIIKVLQLEETTLKSMGNEGRKNVVINKF